MSISQQIAIVYFNLINTKAELFFYSFFQVPVFDFLFYNKNEIATYFWMCVRLENQTFTFHIECCITQTVYFILSCHISIIKTFSEFVRTNKRTISIVWISNVPLKLSVENRILLLTVSDLQCETVFRRKMNRFIILFGFIITANAGENKVNSLKKKMFFCFLVFRGPNIINIFLSNQKYHWRQHS